MSLIAQDLLAIMPFLICVTGALVVVLFDLAVQPSRSRGFLGVVAIVFLAIAALWCWLKRGGSSHAGFSGLIVVDGFSLYLGFVVCTAAMLCMLLAMARMSEKGTIRGESYALMLIATAGGVMLTQSSDLISLFISLECLSIPAYILAASGRSDERSAEAGMKYFILGAFATAFLVYGIALVYGFTGTTNFNGISAALATMPGGTDLNLCKAGMLFIIIALGFKIAAVPFHFWTPDVYEGAPTHITAFFAAVVKCAAFGVLVRVLFEAMPTLRFETPILRAGGWYYIMFAVSVLTMTVGNLLALVQNNIKRMLAFSSIAHAGYLLIGVVSGGTGVAALIYYLTAYVFMTIGAFAIVSYFEKDHNSTMISFYEGLGHYHPLAAIAMTVFMLSLAGIPPTVGFVAKFYLFEAAIRQGEVVLGIIAVINSVIGAAYYIRIVVMMFMQERRGYEVVPFASFSVALIFVVSLMILIVLGAGLKPEAGLSITKSALGWF